MGVLQTMWHVITGRRSALDQQQDEVSRALALQRAETRRLNDELDGKVDELRGSDARMMSFLAGLRVETSRAKKGQH